MFSAEQQRPDSQPPRSALRAILPYTTVLTIIVAVYVAWVMYSRYASDKEAVQKAQESAAAAEQQRNATITQHGELTFTTFYASDATVAPGQSTRLCYGVINAKTVKIEPPIEQLRPTERHCMDISPKKTTTYSITAADDAGRSKTLSLSVKVK
jgi:hypothetical protein